MAEVLAVVGSISAVLQVGQAACSLAQALHTFCQNVKSVNEAVRGLAVELQALGTSCFVVHTLLQRLDKTHGEEDEDMQYETMWDCVRTQVEECDKTIESLAQCLEGVQKDEGNFVFQSARQIRLNLKKGRIEEFRSRIKLHMACLQIMLQSVNIVISNLAPRQAGHELLDKLDILAKDLKELKAIHRLSQPDDVVSVRYSHTAALRLSQEIIAGGQKLCRDSVRSGAFVRRSQSIQHSAKRASRVDVETFRNSSYDSDAESDDDMAIELAAAVSDATREAFENEEWNDTIALVEQMQDGVETGNMRWSRVEPQRGFELVYMHALSTFMARDPSEARPVLASFTKQKSSDGEQKCQILNAKYALSLTYVRQDELSLAKTVCSEVLSGRKKLLGKDHEARLHSVALMSYISRLQGDPVASRVWLTMIPDHRRLEMSSMFRGFSPATAGSGTRSFDDQALLISRPIPDNLLAGLFPTLHERNDSKVAATAGAEQAEFGKDVALQGRQILIQGKDRADSVNASPDVWDNLPLPAKFQLLNLSYSGASTDDVTQSCHSPVMQVPSEIGISPATPNSSRLRITDKSLPEKSRSPPLSPSPPPSSASPRSDDMESPFTLHRGIDMIKRGRLVSASSPRFTEVDKAVWRSDLNALRAALGSSTMHQRSHSDQNVNDSRGSQGLRLAAIFGDVRMAEVLIGEGFGVNDSVQLRKFPGKRSPSRSSPRLREGPLHIAIGARRVEMVRFLLEHGAVLESQDPEVEYATANLINYEWFRATDGESAQEVVDVLEALISKGWSIHRPVAKTGGHTVVDILLNHSQCPFDRAAVIRYCRGKGFDLWSRNVDGKFPLEIVVARDDLEGMSALLENVSFAEANSADSSGNTALHFAVNMYLRTSESYLAMTIIEKLLAAGSSRHARNLSGETPLDVVWKEKSSLPPSDDEGLHAKVLELRMICDRFDQLALTDRDKLI